MDTQPVTLGWIAPVPLVALPGEPGGGSRWPATKKAELIRRVHAGEETYEGAHDKWGFSPEELSTWTTRLESFGTRGLAVTKLQQVRLP